MSSAPKVNDIDEEDNPLRTKIKLTKNEYHATIRNRLEYNRLRVIKRHLGDQNDLNACKLRTSVHDIKRWLNNNQRVACNIPEFLSNRKVQSAGPHYYSRMPGVYSSLSRMNNSRVQNRLRSASTFSRPYTAPLQTVCENERSNTDAESDEEMIPISMSRLASGKRSVMERPMSVAPSVASFLTQTQTESIPNDDDTSTSIIPSTTHRITWPVRMRVFTLQDENEVRQQLLAWRAEQRKTKARRPSNTYYDSELERQYQESIRRRQEIEAYVTPELVKEHKDEDPVFAKRFRQLKIAVRSGKVPSYDSNDREINVKITKSKIERTKSELITATQSKIKTFYRNQQSIHDINLGKRIETFLKRVNRLKEQQLQDCPV